MNTELFIFHLSNLFSKPSFAWETIHKEYHDSIPSIFKQYMLIFFILIPASQIGKSILTYSSIYQIVAHGLIIPLILLSTYVFSMYLVSVVIEIAAHYFNAKFVPLAGAKLCYFSSLPFLALIIFQPLPKLGNYFALLGFVYQFYLIYKGSSELLNVRSMSRVLWAITVCASFGILFLLMLLVAIVIILSMKVF